MENNFKEETYKPINLSGISGLYDDIQDFIENSGISKRKIIGSHGFLYFVEEQGKIFLNPKKFTVETRNISHDLRLKLVEIAA